MLATGPDFANVLRQEDQALRDREIPAEVLQRLQQRLAAQRAPAPARRWHVAMGLVVATAVAVAVFVRRDSAPLESSPEEPLVAGLVVDPACRAAGLTTGSDGTLSVDRAGCSIVGGDRDVRATSMGAMTVKIEADGMRLVRGAARLSVAKRKVGEPPARVQVSHGRIEVLGTEFSVRQDSRGGDVVLHEGVIRFVDKSGQHRTLKPGQTLKWPLSRPEPPVKASESPQKHEIVQETFPPQHNPGSERQQQRILDELSQLRSRGQYTQAASLLRKALGKGAVSKALRQQLSFELGAILADRLGRVAEACNHWQQHQRSYPDGRYQMEIASSQKRHGCAQTR
jgi:hypothetical protein